MPEHLNLLDEILQRIENTLAHVVLSSANANITTTGAAIESRVNLSLSAAKEKVSEEASRQNERYESIMNNIGKLVDKTSEFALKSEQIIRFDALEKKLDAAFNQLQQNKGHDSGVAASWSVMAVVISLAIGGISLIVTLFLRR